MDGDVRGAGTREFRNLLILKPRSSLDAVPAGREK